MVSVTNTTSTSATTPTVTSQPGGFASLGQGDFLKLLTVQMQQQDPFDPVDNKEMLAQMAQFSSLAGISEMGETLTSISEKLDSLIALQNPADPSPEGSETAGDGTNTPS